MELYFLSDVIKLMLDNRNWIQLHARLASSYNPISHDVEFLKPNLLARENNETLKFFMDKWSQQGCLILQ